MSSVFNSHKCSSIHALRILLHQKKCNQKDKRKRAANNIVSLYAVGFTWSLCEKGDKKETTCLIQSLIRSFIKNIKRLLRLCIQIPFMFYIIFILRKTSLISVSRTNLCLRFLTTRICQHISCSTNELRWSNYFNS